MASTGSSSSVLSGESLPAQTGAVVALISCNHASTIRDAVDAARAVLARRVGPAGSAVLFLDGGSTDGTRDRIADFIESSAVTEVQFARPAAALAEEPYHGFPGRATALRAIFEEAQRLGARACVVVDAGMGGDPARIERMLDPVFSDARDYVAAYYARHRYEGALTKGIVYPAFRALYGVTLRQPLTSEFCCSADLVDYCLKQDFWEFEHATTGVDLWLASTAATGDFRLCEAALGTPRPLPSGPAPDLSTTLAQVVGALFTDIEARAETWQRVRVTKQVPLVGDSVVAEAEAQPPSLERLHEAFQLGYQELRDIWTWILPASTIVELRRLASAPLDQLRFDDTFWAGVIYDYAFGYTQRVMPRDHLLRSLTPLYAGWLASFAGGIRAATADEIERRLEDICRAFESRKRQFIARWRWPERLRR